MDKQEKKITLKGYVLKPFEPTMLELNLPSLLVKALTERATINKRFLQHNELDISEEGDFIGEYKNDKKVFFGSLLRMKRGEANSILMDQLERPSLHLEDIAKQSEDNVAGVIKDYGYFCMNKEYLVMTAGHISRKALQGYFNWLLSSSEGGAPVCKIEPQVNNAETAPISDIRSISISEAYFNQKRQYQTMVKDIALLKGKVIKDLLVDAQGLDDLAIEDLISATIRLKFRMGNKKKQEDKKEVLAALFQSVDSDDIVINTKNGKKIRGGTFEVKKQISVEMTETGFLREIQLETEMREFLKNVGNIEAHN